MGGNSGARIRYAERQEKMSVSYTIIKADPTIIKILNELERATKKFGPFNSMHEGSAVIREEFEEMWDEVKGNNVEAAIEEAIQVAAMAIRFVLDLHPENNSNPFDLVESPQNLNHKACGVSGCIHDDRR